MDQFLVAQREVTALGTKLEGMLNITNKISDIVINFEIIYFS